METFGTWEVNILSKRATAVTFYPFSCSRDDTVGENTPASDQDHQTWKERFQSDEKTLREPVLGDLLVLHAQRLHDLPLVFSGPCFGCSFALLSLRLVLDYHLGKQFG